MFQPTNNKVLAHNITLSPDARLIQGLDEPHLENARNIISLALQDGANPNACYNTPKQFLNAKTILMRAVNKGDPAIVEMLVKHGANINARNDLGGDVFTALVESRLINHNRQEIESILRTAKDQQVQPKP